jgi:protein-tyrosine-phosphatase
LSERLAALALADLPVEPWEDVEDPAGGEDQVYLACVKELADLCADLAPRLG